MSATVAGLGHGQRASCLTGRFRLARFARMSRVTRVRLYLMMVLPAVFARAQPVFA